MKNKHREISRCLLECGANVEVFDNKHQTPLHIAASDGSLEILEILLEQSDERKVNVNISRDGTTPLHVAASNGHKAIVDFLLQKFPDIELENKDFLHRSNHSTHSNLSSSPPENAIAYNSSLDSSKIVMITSSPLHQAARNGHIDIVKLLVDHGADVDVTDGSNKTPLHVATFRGHEKVVKLLLLHHANPHLVDSHGFTALHFAQQRLDTGLLQFRSIIDMLQSFISEDS